MVLTWQKRWANYTSASTALTAASTVREYRPTMGARAAGSVANSEAKPSNTAPNMMFITRVCSLKTITVQSVARSATVGI